MLQLGFRQQARCIRTVFRLPQAEKCYLHRPAAGNSVILSPAEVKRVATGIQLELAWLFMVLLQLRSRGSFAQVLEGEHRDFAQPWCSSPSSRPLIP